MDHQFQRNPRVEIAPLDNELILFDPPSSKFLRFFADRAAKKWPLRAV
jgi:hypothetical protein